MKNLYLFLTCMFFIITVDCHAQWELVNSFKNSLGYVDCFIQHDSTLFAVNYNGIYRSIDNGKTWDSVNSGIPSGQFGFSIFTLFITGDSVLACTDTGLYVSTNDGDYWLLLNDSIIHPTTALLRYKSILLAGTADSGVYSSTDNGASWIQKDTGLYSDIHVETLFNADTALFLSSVYGESYRSTDMGAHWSQIEGLPIKGAGFYYTFAYNVGELFAGSMYGDGDVYVSSNLGQSWDTTNNNLPLDSWVNSIAVYDTIVFLGTSNGVFMTTNNGSNWIAENEGNDSSGILALGIGGGYLYAGTTGNGLLRRPLTDFTTGITEQQPVAPPLSLQITNYPNPFSSSTHIVLSSTVQSAERVSVVDVLGREIAVLSPSLQGIGSNGTPELQWSPDVGVSAGMYWIVARGKSGVASRAVMLLK